MFARSNLDRFGRPSQALARRAPVPGPGAYRPADSTGPPGGAAWAFASGVARAVLEDGSSRPGVPGPAYYNPSMLGKKSFNLNAARRWV